MEYKTAKKALRRIGTARASGDALRAMYAKLIAFHCRVGDKAIPTIYKHLQQQESDTEIFTESRRLMREPAVILDVVFFPEMGRRPTLPP